MKDRLPLVADLLMDAAHADDALEGTEKAAVSRSATSGRRSFMVVLDGE